jgi:hypothetical protein
MARQAIQVQESAFRRRVKVCMFAL